MSSRCGRTIALAAVVSLTVMGMATAAAAQQDNTLRLSLAEALELALEQNLDIAVVNYDRRIAFQNVVSARGLFDPIFRVGVPGATAVVGSPGGGFGQAAPAVGGIGFNGSKTPSTSALAGADVSESDAFTTQATFDGLLTGGARAPS